MLLTYNLIPILAAASTQYEKRANIAGVFFYIFLVLALAALAFALYCFFRFNIIKLINDLSGRTAKKSIAQRRKENEASGDKSFRPSPAAKERGRTTDKIRESEKIGKNKQPKKAPPVPPAVKSETTTPLDAPTEMLVNTPLRPADPTTPLAVADPEGGTEPLVKPDLEAGTEPLVMPDLEGGTEPLVKPDLEAGTEPLVMPDLEGGTEPLVKPDLEGGTEPLVKPDLEGGTEPLVRPDLEAGTELLSGGTELLVSDAATEPETEMLPSNLESIQSIVLINTDETINL